MRKITVVAVLVMLMVALMPISLASEDCGPTKLQPCDPMSCGGDQGNTVANQEDQEDSDECKKQQGKCPGECAGRPPGEQAACIKECRERAGNEYASKKPGNEQEGLAEEAKELAKPDKTKNCKSCFDLAADDLAGREGTMLILGASVAGPSTPIDPTIPMTYVTGMAIGTTYFEGGCADGKGAEKKANGANGESGKGGGIGEIGQLLSGVGAIMSGVAALMQADTAKKDHELKKQQFEFDKWKYFNDQAKQDAQCGKNGVSPSGGKCQNDQPGSSTGTAGFGFGDDANTFCDDKGNCQDMTKIPKKSKLVFASIHMTFPFTGNMFSLIKGVRNGIEFFDGTGHVELDSNGVTQMDIYYKEGQPILDKNRQLTWLIPGSTTYYGSDNSNPDTYETNTAMWHLNSAIMTVTTIARDGDEFSRAMSHITGAQSYSPPHLTTGLSFNHFGLPDYQNAIDISENGGTFNVLTRGYIDAAIYGFGGYFPFMSRNVLKGDTVIVKNKDMGVATGYIMRDGIFSYLVMNLEGSAKVITENSKIIQDASGIPRELSNREYTLLYNVDSAFKSMSDKKNLVFS